MNKFMQLGAALGGAALVVAAGSAYTNANTGMVNGTVGYQEVNATGAVIVSTTYNPNATDASLMDNIVYTTSTDVDTDYTAKLTINEGTAPEVFSCAITGTETPWTITCDMNDEPIAGILTIGLTLTQNDPA